MTARPARSLSILAAVLAAGCSRKSPSGGEPLDAGHVVTTSSPSQAVAFDAVSSFDACTLNFEGPTVDLGEKGALARLGDRLDSAPVELIEREGATWARVRARSLAVDFLAEGGDVGAMPSSHADASGPVTTYVEARIRGLAAKNVAFYLNGKPVGVAALTKGEPRVVAAKAPVELPLTTGINELLLRFGGAPRAGSDALAEVDWVHVGAGEPDPLYAAPTRESTIVRTAFGGEPITALALRAPGFARCDSWLPPGGSVEASFGLEGRGEGVAQVRIVRDRAEPIVVGTVHLSSEDAANGRRISWPLGDRVGSGGALGAVEFAAVSASKGARILFGAPRVSAAAPNPRSPRPLERAPARGVLLVVLGELDTRLLAPYGGPRPVPALSSLAKAGIVFESNRSASSIASAALASMLTGNANGIADEDARLPHGLTTIADAAREAGVTTAMFTANPTTGAAFGFDRGWGTFVAHLPDEEASAGQVFDDAASFVSAHKAERFLVVVHARGGHPPWEATADQQKTLEPENYTGGLDPRHAAELLNRARRQPGSLRFGDADRTRAWALYGLAVDSEDAALGRLLSAVRAAGREGDTLLMVTGDVGLNEAAHIPFADAQGLDEASLGTLLTLVSPDGALAGTRVSTPTSSIDVARTTIAALGLAPPDGFGGVDLFETATGRVPPNGRPLMAQAGDRFALRWDHYVLSGAHKRETKLCDLSLEEACVTDVRPAYPLALEILHRTAFEILVGSGGPPREPATLDAATQAALRTWGR